MSGMDRLTDEQLELLANYGMTCTPLEVRMARELLAHRRASQAAPAPSDGLREAARQVVEWFDTVAPQQRGPRIERLRAALTAYPAQDGEPRHG